MDAVITVLGGHPVVLNESRRQAALADNHVAGQSKQQRRIGRTSTGERADAICDELREAIFRRMTSGCTLGWEMQ